MQHMGFRSKLLMVLHGSLCQSQQESSGIVSNFIENSCEVGPFFRGRMHSSKVVPAGLHKILLKLLVDSDQ
jgi:hypothetical protein